MSNKQYYEEIDGEVKPVSSIDKETLEKYYKTLGKRIRSAREEAGYTLVMLSEEIGLTQSAISNYEQGIRQIPVHVLIDLADILIKPLHYFLGPDVQPPLLITKALKDTVERFSNASYIKNFYDLNDGKLNNCEKPEPFIPVPIEIAKDHQFALREYNEDTKTYNYYLCKWYHPKQEVKGRVIKKKTGKIIPPEPDDLILAEKGDTELFELVHFKNVTPSENETLYDPYEINVRAIVLAKIERLVK